MHNAITDLANAARRLLTATDPFENCAEFASLEKALHAFDVYDLAMADIPSRMPDEKLKEMWREAVEATGGRDGAYYAEAALAYGRRIADYADHLRGLLITLANNADLAALVYATRDNELQGWEGPRVKAVGEAVAGILAEIKARPDQKQEGDGS